MNSIAERSFLLASALLLGGCAGALAGSLVAQSISPRLPQTVTTTTTEGPSLPPTSTPLAPSISLVPVERRTAASLLPPAFVGRQTSALGTLYRKPKGTTFEERLLSADRELGQAVALTSDGWFVTSAAVFGTLRLADIALWYNGNAYPIQKGLIDRLNDTIYLKTDVSGITLSAFARISDLTVGSEVWMETRPQEFVPSLVSNTRGREAANVIVSSERATRRILISGTSLIADQGAAVWDPSGSLVGLIESKAGERVRLVPASTIASSFSSLLANGEIRHAALGVHVLDAASLRVDLPREEIPQNGAWVRDEKGKNYAKLKTDDVILRVEHDILDGTADLGEVLADYRPDAQVTLRILRDGKDLDVPIVLGTLVTSEILK